VRTLILLGAALTLGAPLSAQAGPKDMKEALHPDEGGDRPREGAPEKRAIPLVEGAGGPHEGHHEPRHGGALVPLGRDQAHLEFVLEPETGLLTLHVLDGQAEEPLRLRQEMVFLKLETDEGEFAIVLFAQESSATGERKGDSATFAARHLRLEGVQGFDAMIEGITVNRRSFRRVTFRFPDGTEDSAQ